VIESPDSRRRRRRQLVIVAIVIFAMLATALAGVVAAFADPNDQTGGRSAGTAGPAATGLLGFGASVPEGGILEIVVAMKEPLRENCHLHRHRPDLRALRLSRD